MFLVLKPSLRKYSLFIYMVFNYNVCRTLYEMFKYDVCRAHRDKKGGNVQFEMKMVSDTLITSDNVQETLSLKLESTACEVTGCSSTICTVQMQSQEK